MKKMGSGLVWARRNLCDPLRLCGYLFCGSFTTEAQRLRREYLQTVPLPENAIGNRRVRTRRTVGLLRTRAKDSGFFSVRAIAECTSDMSSSPRPRLAALIPQSGIGNVSLSFWSDD